MNDQLRSILALLHSSPGLSTDDLAVFVGRCGATLDTLRKAGLVIRRSAAAGDTWTLTDEGGRLVVPGRGCWLSPSSLIAGVVLHVGASRVAWGLDHMSPRPARVPDVAAWWLAQLVDTHDGETTSPWTPLELVLAMTGVPEGPALLAIRWLCCMGLAAAHGEHVCVTPAGEAWLRSREEVCHASAS